MGTPDKAYCLIGIFIFERVKRFVWGNLYRVDWVISSTTMGSGTSCGKQSKFYKVPLVLAPALTIRGIS